MLRQPDEGASFPGELPKGNRVLLVVRDKKCELVTQSKKRYDSGLISWNGEIC